MLDPITPALPGLPPTAHRTAAVSRAPWSEWPSVRFPASGVDGPLSVAPCGFLPQRRYTDHDTELRR